MNETPYPEGSQPQPEDTLGGGSLPAPYEPLTPEPVPSYQTIPPGVGAPPDAGAALPPSGAASGAKRNA